MCVHVGSRARDELGPVTPRAPWPCIWVTARNARTPILGPGDPSSVIGQTEANAGGRPRLHAALREHTVVRRDTQKRMGDSELLLRAHESLLDEPVSGGTRWILTSRRLTQSVPLGLEDGVWAPFRVSSRWGSLDSTFDDGAMMIGFKKHATRGGRATERSSDDGGAHVPAGRWGPAARAAGERAEASAAAIAVGR